MTEQGWLSGTDPLEMFALVEEKASDRKLRLFLTREEKGTRLGRSSFLQRKI
jgi:hypothetical protein